MYQYVGWNPTLEYGKKDYRRHERNVDGDGYEYSTLLPSLLYYTKKEHSSRKFDEYHSRVPERDSRDCKLFLHQQQLLKLIRAGY
jgi:hypothetical protein